MIRIIKNRKIWLSLSAILVATSIVFLALWRLNFGIDFTGGSLLEISFEGQRPERQAITEALSEAELGGLSMQFTGEDNVIFRFQNTEEAKHEEVLQKLRDLADTEEQKLQELRYDSVGPAIGQELKEKSLSAIIVVLLAIVVYIAWAFRKVSKPVASWKFGITAIITLFHDVLVVLGIFAFLGKFYSVEINTAFVAAILTVLGYSVNDTIVVFDRIRENLLREDEEFDDTVNKSINQTITRSINTSLTTLLVLLSILFFGGDSIQDFVLALSIGVFIGTYSSIFLASPLLVVWEKFRK